MVLNKKFLAIAILACGLMVAAVITHAQISSSNNSVSLKKDPGTGFFVLTIKASAGIKEFVLHPSGKSPYGGGLGGCPTTYKNDLVVFADPDDFTPKMGATITDCKKNSIDFDLLPPKNGLVIGTRVLPPAETPAAAPAPAPGETKLEPKNQILTNVKFPVPELNNCQSETECVSYCDDVAHAKVCLEFAKKNNILPADEIEKREKLVDITDGPGGCNSQKSCESYCGDIDKLDECFAFAEKHDFLSDQDKIKIGKIKTAIKAGVKLPGGCNNQKSCESYCNDANHSDECLAFGEQSGFLDAQEIQQYRKFSELQKSGETPGKCSSKESCEAYCNGPDNADECISFAEKAGFLSGDELEQAKKVLPLLKEGKTPGGCRNKQQCQSYCEGEGHADECIEFALKAGMMSPQEAEMMKKTGGKGPGGCHSKEQCETYCQQNPQECMSWAKENGLEGEFAGPGGGGAGFSGPGGCKNQEECMAYCKANQEDQACKKMMQDFGGGAGSQGGPGGGAGGFGGPGGCKSQEECQAYCKDHPQECQNFSPPGGGGFPGGPGDGGNEHDGLSECGITTGSVAAYVCGVNGKHAKPGVETTYFNECHAKQHGAEILHKGVCKGHKPCSDIADPVCGNDNNTWISTCYAEQEGGGVQYGGVCKGQSGGGFSGPGGCQSQEECQAYCQSHPQECGGGSGGGGPSGGPGGCKSQEECQAYCQEHPAECGGGGGGSSGGGGSPAAQSCVQTPSGLVSWWNGDTPSDVKDGNNGTISGGVTIVSGKVGSAFKFDGSGGYINMGSPANLNFGTGPFSLEAWFNWDGRGSSVNNIIRKSNYGPGAGAGYWIRIGRDAQVIEFSVGATTGPEGQTLITAPVSPGAWRHVVATRDSSDAVKLYVDGQSIGTFLRQASKAESTSESPFALGAWADQHSEFFSGLIDEVSVYSRALSASEVQAIFNAGSAGKCSDQSQSSPQTLPPSGQIPQEYCSGFASVPSCSYVGAPGSQNYNYCKQCFPDK